MITMSEIQIQSGIIDYLLRRKHFFIRINNTPISMIRNGQRVFRKMGKGAIKGVPDILVLTNGGFAVWLEVKDKGKKQSPDQVKFQNRCNEIGCEYYVVRSIDDLKEIGL